MLQCEKYMISNLEKLEHEIQYGWDSSPEKQASLFRMSKWISNIDALQKKRMELKEHTQLEDSIAESIFRIEKPQQLILIHDAMEELKNIRRRNNIGELNAEIYKLERLGEKIFAEKDWGTGNDKLISSEKNIILQLYCLQSAIRELQEESTNRENAVSAIAEAVSNLNRAVFERMEWKKVSDEEENDA